MSIPEPDKKYTYSDYLKWDSRYELLAGIPYLLAGASYEHQKVVGEIYRQLANQLIGKPCEAMMAPFDVKLPLENEAEQDIMNVVQPDLLIICDHSKISNGYSGAPPFIIEVTSPTTAKRDAISKLNLYEKTGVSEYWIVHPSYKMIEVYQLKNNVYGMPERYSEGIIALKHPPGLSVDLATVFERE